MTDSEEAIELLKDLIRIPSFSREEKGTLKKICAFLESKGIPYKTVKNNVYAVNEYYDPALPTILLNSHHDTVKPNQAYTKDPFEPTLADGKLYGLGSNDAGGALVSLIMTFCSLYNQKNLEANVVLGISAEEEISGKNGVELLLQHLPPLDAGIVGEPTSGKAAVTEKGLLVLDCTTRGKPGHAGRNEGINALYLAMEDIQWFRSFQFPKVSETLGPVHMNVTVIHCGEQHNMVPETCTYTVDVRTTDAYSLEETLAIIEEHVHASVKPRSVRLRPSSLTKDKALYRAAEMCKFEIYGSPTLSDQALMSFPTIKFGPGDSSRSHSADEFIYIEQIENGLRDYHRLIETYFTLISES